MDYVYMLRCGDGSLYTGWTNDIDKRIEAHRSGRGAKYTRGRGPLELVHLEILGTRSEALKREAYIKRLSRDRKEMLMNVVETKYGAVMGQVENGSVIYKGIPYAAPPVGSLRFMPARPPAAWEGVRDCTAYGAPSVQLFMKNHVPQPEILDISDEDCLYLNVRTPGVKGDRLPVYVFVHGGAYESGGCNKPGYDGSLFCSHGVVYVNINYRLDALGAMAFRNVKGSGSLQMTDTLMAIRWVKENIEAFGGDPDRITVGGESAGAFTVSALLLLPQTRGLIRRAILESGSIRACVDAEGYGRGITEKRYADTSMIMEELIGDGAHTDENLEKLRALPAEKIIKAWHYNTDGSTRKRIDPNPLLAGFIDGGNGGNPEDPVPDPLNGITDVDLLFCYNTDEGSMFVDPFLTEEAYLDVIKSRFPKDFNEVLKRFPAEPGDTRQDPDRGGTLKRTFPSSQLVDLDGLMKFKGSLLPFADELSRRGNAVYGCQFDYLTEKLKKQGLGVRHISEINMVFGTFLGEIGADDEAGRAASEYMNACWCEFIEKGSIGGWRRWKPLTSEYLQKISRNGSENVISCVSAERTEEMRYLDRLAGKGEI